MKTHISPRCEVVQILTPYRTLCRILPTSRLLSCLGGLHPSILISPIHKSSPCLQREGLSNKCFHALIWTRSFLQDTWKAGNRKGCKTRECRHRRTHGMALLVKSWFLKALASCISFCRCVEMLSLSESPPIQIILPSGVLPSASKTCYNDMDSLEIRTAHVNALTNMKQAT